MKMLILSGLILLSAAVSEAAGRNEAYQICQSMDFDSGKNSCTQKIGKYSYYDQQAIEICKGMDFDASKLSCVSNIGDKSYEQYELQTCASNDFDANKNTCLTKNGRAANVMLPHPGPDHNYGCISKSELQRELSRVDRLVSLGDNGRALQVIRRLQSDVSCN